MLTSVVWSMLFPAANSWTEEKVQRMTDLGIKAHELGDELDGVHRHPKARGGRTAYAIDAEYKQAVAELDQLRAEFESKRDAPKQATTFLRWSGAAFVVAGAFVTFA